MAACRCVARRSDDFFYRHTLTWLLRAYVAICLLADPTQAQAAVSSAQGLTTDVFGYGSNSLAVLSLDDALLMTQRLSPAIAGAVAAQDLLRYRLHEAMANFAPTVQGSANYSRQTANFVLRPGMLPTSLSGGAQSLASESRSTSYNYFNFALQLTQPLWDFGSSLGSLRAARAAHLQGRAQASATLLNALLTTRQAFFAARAARILARVSHETLNNQRRHQLQVQGQVEVGTRPQIDLAQAKVDLANAQVSCATAGGNYAVARAQLQQAIGLEGLADDFEVADETMPPVDGEDGPLQALVDEALRYRPELAAGRAGVTAQQQRVRSAQGSLWPQLSATAQLTDAGQDIRALGWNWSAGGQLGWAVNTGGTAMHQIQQARASLRQLKAEQGSTRLAVRLDVQKAQLAIRTWAEAQTAAGEAVNNASAQLRLAQGRYAEGLGGIIELSDAQLAYASAQAQQVQAAQGLASARAQLLFSLGRAS